MRRSLFVMMAALAALALLATQAVAADIVGTNGPDNIVGTPGNDNINGRNGNDSIAGNDGGDVIIGSFGADTLIGNDEPDDLYGRSGNDKLWGEVMGCGFSEPTPPRAQGPFPGHTPCPGHDRDKFHGGQNNDVIHADDRPDMGPPTIVVPGNPEWGEYINCGGGIDTAWVDNNDSARADVGKSDLYQTCETIYINGSPLPP